MLLSDIRGQTALSGRRGRRERGHRKEGGRHRFPIYQLVAACLSGASPGGRLGCRFGHQDAPRWLRVLATKTNPDPPVHVIQVFHS